MAKKYWLDEQVEKYKNDEEYILEGKILQLTEQISERLRILGWNKKILAEKLHTSQAWVTKLLNGENNFTLKSLVKISKVLGLELDIKFATEGLEKTAVYSIADIQSQIAICKISGSVLLNPELTRINMIVSQNALAFKDYQSACSEMN